MPDLPDSGSRVKFGENTAVREGLDAKPAIEGISPYMLIRLGNLLRKAETKYDNYRNWELGMPFMRYVGGILRHTALYVLRDSAEDHLAAIAWNAMCLMHHEEVGQYTFDDRPRWNPPTPTQWIKLPDE